MENTLNYNEDFVVRQLLADHPDFANFYGNSDEFSDYGFVKKYYRAVFNPVKAIYRGSTQTGREIDVAETALKERLKKKYGKKWWHPKNLKKFRAEFEKERNKLIKAIKERHKQEKFEHREEKRKSRADRRLEQKKEKWSAKDERSNAQAQKEFEIAMEQQKQIAAAQAPTNFGAGQPTAADDKTAADKKKKQTILFAIIGTVVFAAIITAAILFNRKNK